MFFWFVGCFFFFFEEEVPKPELAAEEQQLQSWSFQNWWCPLSAHIPAPEDYVANTCFPLVVEMGGGRHTPPQLSTM